MSNLSSKPKKKNKKAISEKEAEDDNFFDSDLRFNEKDSNHVHQNELPFELKMSNKILFFSPKVFLFVLLCLLLLVFSETCDLFQRYAYLLPMRYSTTK